MAEEINVRVKHKGMKLAEWNKSTVILMERELGVATDTGEVRVGNGTDRWTSLPIIKGEKGEPLKVESTTKNSQGDTIIKFDDGSSATVSKGDKGDSITISSHKKDGQGNTVINFSDGSNITVDKGDSITVESTSTDSNGNTLVKFSDGSSATIAKGDKGDPLKFDDLTQEQINQIKAQDVDLTNYATKDHSHRIQDLDDWEEFLEGMEELYGKLYDKVGYVDFQASVDGLEKKLEGKANSTHTHTIADVTNLQTELNKKASSTHTHSEYVTATDLDNKSDIKVLDTRNDDRDPLWYMKNYGSKQVFEFKYRKNVGNPPVEASASKNYTIVLTRVPWRDKTGGYPTQLSFGERIALRIGTSETTWGEWKTLATTDDVDKKSQDTERALSESLTNIVQEIGDKAEKDHTHDEYIRSVGVNASGQIVYTRDNKEWKLQTIGTTYGNELALKNHTHPEYLKKGDPIELTSAQKAELKGADGKDGLTTFIRYANNPSGTNMTASPQSDTTHIGIFASEGRVSPPTPSVYQWTRIKGEPGKQGNPGTPGRDGTSVTTWVGTQSQYDRIYSKSSTTLYLIKG